MSVKKKRKNSKLTDKVKSEIQLRYRQGESLSEIAKDLEIKKNTIDKAISQDRLILTEPESLKNGARVLNQSDRSIIDNATGIGKACSNSLDRVLAGRRGLTVDPKFDCYFDVHQAGVLLSLPALLSNGLLTYSEDFKLNKGVYYSEQSIFLCLAFLSLLRIKNLNQVQEVPCGELGRAMGLDRIPEVKTLRQRVAAFAEQGDVEVWSRKLSRDWMQSQEDLSGVLYVDGHVGIYYGHATRMPKRFVSRLRLCMSGSTDYYVNDRTGQPFFVVNETINSGLIEQIKTTILPRLEEEVPNQPTEEELHNHPELHKFMLVFDREGYSVDLFGYLQEKRIAFCTYNKNVKDEWPSEEFHEYEMLDEPTGMIEKAKLAEREVILETKSSSSSGIKVREIRKLTTSGHQTSILTNNRILTPMQIGFYMFARWCQENFFKYMLQNFGIDGLVSYQHNLVSETRYLVNPQYRNLESQIRSLNAKLARKRAKFGGIILKEGELQGKKLDKAIAEKAKIHEEIRILEEKVASAKEKRRNTQKKILFAELPLEEQFTSAINARKHFMDLIKMIAYRSETGMYHLIKPQMNPHHRDEGRNLLQRIYNSNADIIPNYENQTLTVKIHHLNNHKEDLVLEYLCKQLNETETEFPGTNLKLIFKLVSS